VNKLIRKKILWISDFSLWQYPYGGAEITDSLLIKRGKKLIANITPVLCDSVNKVNIDDSELIILSNNFNLSLRNRDYIMRDKKYICLVQDCGRWMNTCLQTPDLLKNSILNIYMSPGQRDIYLKHFPEQKHVCIPPTVPDIFKNKNTEREDKILFVGFLHEGKGIGNVINYAKNNPKKIDFYGYCQSDKWLKAIEWLGNTTFKGGISMESLPEVYNRYKYYIHLPNIYESFSRTTAEALLCGCQLIHNGNLGILSYYFDTKGLREAVTQSDIKFWNTVNNLF